MLEEVKQEGDFKIKSKPKMKKFNKEAEVIKVDLSAKDKIEPDIIKVDLKQSDANKEQETAAMVADKPAEAVQEMVTEVSSGESSVQNEGFAGIQEITGEEVKEVVKEAKEAIRDEKLRVSRYLIMLKSLLPLWRKREEMLKTMLGLTQITQTLTMMYS